MAVLFSLLNIAAISAYVLYYSDAEKIMFLYERIVVPVKRDFSERVKKSSSELKRR
jgi:hypothetical protein